MEGELLLDGSRVAGTLPPIVENPSFAIRKKASAVFPLEQYIAHRTMNAAQTRSNPFRDSGAGEHPSVGWNEQRKNNARQRRHSWHFHIDVQGPATLQTLGNDDLRAALAQVFDDPVRIERLVGNQAAEFDILDKWGHADGIVALPGEQDEADQVAQGVCQGQDFGRLPALRLADGFWL